MSVLILFLSLFIGINIRYSLIAGIIELTLLFLFLIYKRNKKLIVISISVILVGVGLSFIRPSFTKERYSGFITEVKDNYFIFSSSLEKFYVKENNNDREIGDYVSIKGYKSELDFITLESGFDFKQYLNNKGIYSELKIEEIEVKFYNPIKIHKFKKDFLNKFDENPRGIIGAILFASSKDNDFIEISSELHLMRLISSSTIYLSFFLMLIRKGLSFVIKKENWCDAISLIFFTPYLIFTFPKFLVIKFLLLKWILWINKYRLNKRFKYLEVVSASGIFFLLIDPHLALQDGFILTYFIPISSLFFRDTFRYKQKWKNYFVLTLLIYASFLPFSIKYYSEISILTIPLQLIFTPLYVILFIFSIVSLIGIPIYKTIGGYVSFLNNSLRFLSPSIVKIHVPPFDSVGILIYEIIFFILLFFISIKLKPITRILAPIITISFTLYISPIFSYIKDYVSFINVGQGDSTLIKYKTSTILIDTGGNKYQDIAKEVLIPYFKKKQIYKIDLLITTHDDFDHSGAVNSLITNFTVNNYINDYRFFPYSLNGLILTNYNVYPELWREENDESLVIGFNLNNLNYLVMGDAPIKIERAIMKDNKYIPCDILKVGHHGSKTSTSDDFIKYLSPKVGVISCGKNNYYGHPHQVVIAILKKYHVEIRRTDLESTITF